MLKEILIIGLIILACYKLFGFNGLMVIFCIVLALMGLVYFNQNKILYIPQLPESSLSPSGNPFGYNHPSQQGLNTENVSITTIDNHILKGWMISAPKCERLVVYFHENAGNIGFRIPFMKEIHTRTISNVLLVAYRGYSDSQGQPTEEGLQRDAEAVLQWAINYKNTHLAAGNKKYLYILGRSLGGAVSIYIASHPAYGKEIDGVILENTFTSISQMIDVLLPPLKYVKFLQTNFWPSIDRIGGLKQPILFIRSMKDELVPTEQMVALITAANSCSFKKQYKNQKGTHNIGWEYGPDRYFEQYIDFFAEIEPQNLK